MELRPDLNYVEYPHLDIVEEWSGVYQDQVSDKVWGAGYTESGLYVTAHGRRGYGLTGLTKDCGDRDQAEKMFRGMVRQKTRGSKAYLERAFSRGDKLGNVPSFRFPAKGFEVKAFGMAGWWEPSFEENWLCVVGDRAPVRICGTEIGAQAPGQGLARGGFVPGGVAEMARARVWLTERDQVVKTFVQISEENSVLAARRPEIFPALPNFQAEYGANNYGRQVTPVTCRGILRLGRDLYGLWVDENGREAGWERVANYEEMGRAHAIQLVGLGASMAENGWAWSSFEAGIRQVAFGDAV